MDLVELVFGVVLAGGLVEYRSLIVTPFVHAHLVGFTALLSVYVTSAMSWIGWHKAMENSPYLTEGAGLAGLFERLRLLTDIAIVSVYTYLLFTIEPFRGRPAVNIYRHLIGYPVVFLLYMIWGTLRKVRDQSNLDQMPNRSARYVAQIFWFFLILGLLVVVYRSAVHHLASHRFGLNEATVVAIVLVTLLYRWLGEGRSGVDATPPVMVSPPPVEAPPPNVALPTQEP